MRAKEAFLGANDDDLGWLNQQRGSSLAKNHEMKSEFFAEFGIPVTEYKIKPRLDDRGIPRLWFQSVGMPPCNLNLTSARHLALILAFAGEADHAEEIIEKCEKAERLKTASPRGLIGFSKTLTAIIFGSARRLVPSNLSVKSKSVQSRV